jgi:hypothetical protein
MKKLKRSSHLADQSDSNGFDAEIEGEDDDIIDLEDIIEMPDGAIDEDEDLDLEVEMLEMGSDLGAETQKTAKLSVKEESQFGLEDEDLAKLIEEEPEEDGDEVLFDPSASGGSAKSSIGGGELQIFDEDDESLLDEIVNKPATPQTRPRAGERNLKARTAEALKVNHRTPVADAEPEAAISGEPAAPGSTQTASGSVPPSADDLAQMAEELLGRIESRLQEHIRVTVESKLPDLVRSIIREEVEKLRQELPEGD